MNRETHSFVLPERLSTGNIPEIFQQIKKLQKKGPIALDFSQVQHLDSAAIALVNYFKRNHMDISLLNLSPEFSRSLEMFPISQEEKETGTSETKSFRHKIEEVGERYYQVKAQVKDFMVLLADEIFYTFLYLFKRKGVYPGETMNQLFFMGYKSYPIVSLISFLVGITISITSAQQLRNFGADIYLADLVGFGMIRELVPLMTGIILAGKIGAAITAEIASMKVLEETDALKTMGIVPEKFLMVPRLIAITLAVPLLVAIGDFVGILAGVLVAQIFSGIPPDMFFTEMFLVVDLGDFFIGMIKTLAFGWVIVISSGYKGFSVKRGAAGVGIATTESVVLSIALIIILDCVFAFLLY